MKFSRIAFAAAALALTSGAAIAETQTRRQFPITQGAVMDVGMNRTAGGRTNVFGGPASTPTIFGHAVSRQITVFDDRSPPDRAGGR